MTRRVLQPSIVTALWLMPLLAMLQTTVMGRFVVNGALPGLVLLAVVDWGILRGPDEGMLWGLVGGFCLDVLSGWPIGTGTIAMVAVASVVSLGGSTFIRTHALLPPATMFIATLLYYLVVFFLLESMQHPVDWSTGLRTIALPAAAYNAIVNVPGYMLFRRLEARIFPVPRASW